jgi:hypothetical protein
MAAVRGWRDGSMSPLHRTQAVTAQGSPIGCARNDQGNNIWLCRKAGRARLSIGYR